jgi:hypothetical protein
MSTIADAAFEKPIDMTLLAKKVEQLLGDRSK